MEFLTNTEILLAMLIVPAALALDWAIRNGNWDVVNHANHEGNEILDDDNNHNNSDSEIGWGTGTHGYGYNLAGVLVDQDCEITNPHWENSDFHTND